MGQGGHRPPTRGRIAHGPGGRRPRILDLELSPRPRGPRGRAARTDADRRHQRAPLLGAHQQARGVRERAAQGHVHLDHQLLSGRRRREPGAESPEPRAPGLQLPRVPEPQAAFPPPRAAGPRQPAADRVSRAPQPRGRRGDQEADAGDRGGRRHLRRLDRREIALLPGARRRVPRSPSWRGT